jgi:hypothetical protein
MSLSPQKVMPRSCPGAVPAGPEGAVDAALQAAQLRLQADHSTVVAAESPLTGPHPGRQRINAVPGVLTTPGNASHAAVLDLGRHQRDELDAA